jgi:HTH-type transcriptional regulator, competence development regulator
MKVQYTFGDIIKKLRKDKNLTLREVAEELQIDTSMLGKIERNNRKPSKELFIKLVKFFKVNDNELKIALLSDKFAYQVMDEKVAAKEVLQVAEQKIKYLKSKNKH